MIGFHSDDLYERLGVPSTATAEEIRRAYRVLVRRYPPERAPEEFKRIQEAYDTLRDPQTREEYDNQPDPAVADWLRLTMTAMQEEEYGIAERYLKAVLEDAPDLTFVRNLLGLALLYQNRPVEAVEQYEILLSTSDHSPVWHGNAGQAYRMAGRYREAERAFRRAILSGEDVTPYYLGLADLYIDQKEYYRATQILEKAILHDGEIDFNDLQYFTKLIQVHVLADSDDEVRSVLDRLERLAPDLDDSQREYAALTLANLTRHLLIALRFRPALDIVGTAREFDPFDRDYYILEELAKRLANGDLHGAIEFTHAELALQPGGWLADLGVVIRHLERARQGARETHDAIAGSGDDRLIKFVVNIIVWVALITLVQQCSS